MLMAWLMLAAVVYPQGATVKVRSGADAVEAQMNGRRVRLFPQADGGRLGLIGIPVLEKPGDYALDYLDAAGKVVKSETVTVRDARFPTQNVVLGKQQTDLKASPVEAEKVGAFLKNVTEKRLWPEQFAAPVAGCMNSPFGVVRLHNGKPTGSFHGGADQRSPAGKPITAPADGVVKIAEMFDLRGGTVGLDHGQGLETIYMHMSGFAVKEGAVVKQGDVIGYVGSTGRANGPHLHWSVYANGVAVNPLEWVKLTPCAAAAKTAPKKGPPLARKRR
jgi:murein DD-endopeptidase MepM/ murein hydrolase activator NlpD